MTVLNPYLQSYANNKDINFLMIEKSEICCKKRNKIPVSYDKTLHNSVLVITTYR